jgi:hypothetical protein
MKNGMGAKVLAAALAVSMLVPMEAFAAGSSMNYQMKNWTETKNAGGTKIYQGTCRYPSMTGSTKAAAAINKTIQTDLKTLQKSALQNEADAIERNKEGWDGFAAGGYYFDSELYSDPSFIGDFVSMKYQYSNFTGGAHGLYGTYGYVFSAKDGTQIKLADMLKACGSSDATVASYLSKVLVYRKDHGDFYLNDTYQTDIEGSVLIDGSWYITNNNLILIANPYAISSYAEGQSFFAIPFASLADPSKLPMQTVFTDYDASELVKAWAKTAGKYDGLEANTESEVERNGVFGWDIDLGKQEGEVFDRQACFFVDVYGNIYQSTSTVTGQQDYSQKVR